MLLLLHSDKINEERKVTRGIINHGSTGNVRLRGMNFTMLEKKKTRPLKLKLNAGDEDVNDHDEINISEICDNPVYDEILNGKITELEITEAIRKLKNNKAPGTDNILNEYLKHSSPLLISLYCKVFNLVLDCGIIPESWSSGIIYFYFKF